MKKMKWKICIITSYTYLKFIYIFSQKLVISLPHYLSFLQTTPQFWKSIHYLIVVHVSPFLSLFDASAVGWKNFIIFVDGFLKGKLDRDIKLKTFLMFTSVLLEPYMSLKKLKTKKLIICCSFYCLVVVRLLRFVVIFSYFLMRNIIINKSKVNSLLPYWEQFNFGCKIIRLFQTAHRYFPTRF